MHLYGGEKTGIPHQRKNTRASSFYVYVNVEFYVHAFVQLYDGKKQVC